MGVQPLPSPRPARVCGRAALLSLPSWPCCTGRALRPPCCLAGPLCLDLTGRGMAATCVGDPMGYSRWSGRRGQSQCTMAPGAACWLSPNILQFRSGRCPLGAASQAQLFSRSWASLSRCQERGSHTQAHRDFNAGLTGPLESHEPQSLRKSAATWRFCSQGPQGWHQPGQAGGGREKARSQVRRARAWVQSTQTRRPWAFSFAGAQGRQEPAAASLCDQAGKCCKDPRTSGTPGRHFNELFRASAAVFS